VDLEIVQSLQTDQILMDDDLVSLRRNLRRLGRTSFRQRALIKN
jgi:hypothetical protein